MDAILDEVESLEAILMEDVNIKRDLETYFPELIETTVFPVVGGDTDRQYICVTLQVLPKPGYPDVSPEFNLIKPRGLDDSRLNQIKDACVKKLNESVGYPVVFDLIEVIREHLTGSNLPSGQCVVCLYGFREGDEFTKTECYHYLHSYCLARHLIASRRNYQDEQDKLPAWLRKMSDPFQAVCPVCREPIKDDADQLESAPPPLELENAPEFHLTDDLRELQRKMTNLFLHQKSRGAIIDLDAEESNVISIQPEDETNSDQRKDTGNTLDDSVDENGSDQHSSTLVQISAQRQAQMRANQSRGSNRPNNQTNFTPIVNTSQRHSTESTNNNYSHHYNRRHYRGRRHHNHHHHHHQHHNNQQQQQQQVQNSSQSQQDHPTKHQRSSNANTGCGSSSR